MMLHLNSVKQFGWRIESERNIASNIERNIVRT